MRRALSLTTLLVIAGCPSPEGDDAGTDAPAVAPPDAPGADVALPDAPRSEDPDAPPPAGGVPMFVAIGKYGRITSSCDDGLTWAFNRSDDDGASCLGMDCDHHPGSSTGLTYGGGFFFASYGWGDVPTRLFRSSNGVDWDVVWDVEDAFSMAGIAWAEDRLVAGDPTPRYSLDATDDVATISFLSAEWPDYEVPEGAWPNSRWIAYAPYDGGRIALVAAEGGGAFSDTVISSDGGLTYQHPTTFPEACTGHGPRMAYGGGAWVQTWSTTGAVCTSVDGGQTFTHVDLGEGGSSGALWTGSEFLLYVGGTGYRSTDGLSWSSFATNASPGDIARDPATGTLIALDGDSWGRPYAMQRLYRSTDGGIDWQLLGETAFEHSHPLTHVVFGYGAASAACP